MSVFLSELFFSCIVCFLLVAFSNAVCSVFHVRGLPWVSGNSVLSALSWGWGATALDGLVGGASLCGDLDGPFVGNSWRWYLYIFLDFVRVTRKDTVVSCQEVEAWLHVPGASREGHWDLNISVCSPCLRCSTHTHTPPSRPLPPILHEAHCAIRDVPFIPSREIPGLCRLVQGQSSSGLVWGRSLGGVLLLFK